MERLRNSGGGSGLLVVLFVLVLVAVFLGPNLGPRLGARLIPGFDEGVPCQWLPLGTERAFHQSLIGRAAVDPLSLEVEAGPITQAANEFLVISITLTNNSLGAVPFLYNPNQIIVGDNGTSGLGLIFNPPNSLATGGFRQADPSSYPETDIRVLAPRQRCVVRIEIPNGNVLVDPAVTTGTATVKAYYRGVAAGAVTVPAGTLATPIYPDQGLPRGYVESAPVTIPLASQ